MSAAVKCGICNKTAYPLESIVALEKTYHKGCFKCSVCNITLNVKNFKGLEGKLYCAVHTPTQKATAVADSVAMKTALNAPKKVSEGLGTAQKGSGDKPSVGLDSMSTKNAMNAPRKAPEGARGVQKGTGGKPQYTVFGANPNSPVTGTNLHQDQQQEHYGGGEEQHQYEEEHHQYTEEPQYEEQQYEEQQYEEQYEEQYQ
ncbi:hypothetical protein SAMD00019534_029800 [Acytostelium subglobosum LB1]|uniref:hypothetical protein n=1 Tax=Acytostelium subglobosum LB1 TaxID=1410327 RepID=UPI00064502B4|nr:hypothetical protein SAMD00019534_029800 [Acytostelium subglobosum LB1]GAM19805.1 hypothetical protein SAMD00019534_029800 [Acytostelium subglobosum LB1]|eukprot:XP_012756567.1 hypothetical protein SAMD00019534_029800 [Acytostelium subglobosum LB1]